MNLIPIVIEQTGRGERSYDIYSRLLKVRNLRSGSAEINNYGGHKSSKTTLMYIWKGEIF